jgi:exopolysaccharide biosynthesis polyprenyl glycosylphosphotransferase
VADAVAAGLAVTIGVQVLGPDRLTPAALAAAPLAVLVSKAIGLYDRDDLLLSKTTLNEAPALFNLATLYALLVVMLQSVFVAGRLGGDQIAVVWLLLFILLLTARTIARHAVASRSPVERCFLVGDADTSERLRERFSRGRRLGATLIGYLTPAALEREQNAGAFSEFLTSSDIHRLILAPDELESQDMLELIREVKGLGVKVSIVPRLFEVVGSAVEFDDVNGSIFLGVRRFGLSRSSMLLKRMLDITGSLAALLILAPFFAVAAVAIKLTSPGPVLYSQTRVGRDGQRFRIFKFRTMVQGADEMKASLAGRNEASGLFKIADDPRITRVGRVLRRSSLDELTQLINVLRGDMSLVGPRPLVVDEDEQLRGWHRRRLHLTPGMTGVWQILGSARVPLHEMVTLDYLYITNWSLWTDLMIMLRTVPYVMSRRGQ